jgi:hypothetical protein
MPSGEIRYRVSNSTRLPFDDKTILNLSIAITISKSSLWVQMDEARNVSRKLAVKWKSSGAVCPAMTVLAVRRQAPSCVLRAPILKRTGPCVLAGRDRSVSLHVIPPLLQQLRA